MSGHWVAVPDEPDRRGRRLVSGLKVLAVDSSYFSYEKRDGGLRVKRSLLSCEGGRQLDERTERGHS